MSADPDILIVEDDAEIRNLLRNYLSQQRFRVRDADGGVAFDRSVQLHGLPDLIVLDLMLPGEDGLSICRRLRAHSTVPVIILTARGDDIDRIVGLEVGADDYLPKPFNPRELVARIRAVLRRAKTLTLQAENQVRVGAFDVDLDSRTVYGPDGAPIDLTGAEFDLLICFIERPNRVLSRDQLMDWTRGRRADVFDRTIDVQVSRLRKKLDVGGEPLIKTVRNAGYILAATVRKRQAGGAQA